MCPCANSVGPQTFKSRTAEELGSGYEGKPGLGFHVLPIHGRMAKSEHDGRFAKFLYDV